LNCGIGIDLAGGGSIVNKVVIPKIIFEYFKIDAGEFAVTLHTEIDRTRSVIDASFAYEDNQHPSGAGLKLG
jgi:hypothetical protein